MEIKEFEAFYEKLNDKETKKNGEYGENYTWIEHYPGKHKVDFLKEFTEVFNDIALFTLIVDENIGFINNDECFYINREFLEFCLEYKIYNDDARNFYNLNLDNNMGEVKESYLETFNKSSK